MNGPRNPLFHHHSDSDSFQLLGALQDADDQLLSPSATLPQLGETYIRVVEYSQHEWSLRFNLTQHGETYQVQT